MVGAKDELGRRRCNWIGQVMVLAFVFTISVRQQECNGALAATCFRWGRSLVGARRRSPVVFLSLALILVVNFLGGGGTSSGLWLALVLETTSLAGG